MSILTPKTAGFVSRQAAGLRAPRSVSHNIRPASGGVAIHYGGNDVPTSSASSAAATWRSWQRYHMNSHGWVDIAYTMGVDNWGFVYAGRGQGVRTAAQGTNDGNNRFYAVCWIGGAKQTPTRAALSAIAWAVNELRESGAGDAVRPHSSFKSTSCPGYDLRVQAKKIDGKPFAVPEKPKEEPEKDEWEVFWMELEDNEKQVLKDFVQAIEETGTNARSFVHQLLRRHREDIPALQSRFTEIDRFVDIGQTSLQGVIVGGVNSIDALRDMGYNIVTTERTGPEKTS